MKNLSFRKGILEKKYTNSIIKEVFRKMIHLCSSFIPLFVDKISYWGTIFLLFLVLFIYCISEILRLSGTQVPVISKVTEVAARKRDENKFVLGPVTLVLGIVTALLLWKNDAAQIGIYALAFGDGLASLFGKLFGKRRIPFTRGKTFVGSITCFVAVFISSLCVCNNLFYSLLIAFVAMIIEMLPLKDFDNVLLPVCIGALAQFLIP